MRAPEVVGLGVSFPAPSPASSSLPPAQGSLKTAEDFAAVVLNELLGPMFATVGMADGPFGGGAGEAMFRPMLEQKIAALMARQGGLGLTEAIQSALIHLQEARS